MKKLTLTLCAVAALVSAAFAGTTTYSGKEMKQAVEQPHAQTWYADNEWNIGISGIYAFDRERVGRRHLLRRLDHAWGGAIDVKYFFRRYFGIGVQAFGLSVDNGDDAFDDFGDFDDDGDDNGFAGGVLGTFTFRYPIPCSPLRALRVGRWRWLSWAATTTPSTSTTSMKTTTSRTSSMTTTTTAI